MNKGKGKNNFAVASRNYESESSKYTPMTYNQCIVNEGTEDELVCTAYRETRFRRFLYIFLTILTLGILHLICHWKPAWKVHIRSIPCDSEVASHVILKDKFKRSHVKRIKWLRFRNCSIANSSVSNMELKNVKENGNKPKHSPTSKQTSTKFNFNKKDLQPKRHFEYKFQKYIWCDETFLPLSGLDYDISVRELKNMKGGLSEEQTYDRRVLFGSNSITVPITPYLVILFREIINPFYAFQVFSIIVWCVEEYFLLAGIIALLSAISISLSLYMTRKENELIHRMSSGSGSVKVLSNSKFESRDSTELLPGDVIEIQDKIETLWCDCVLLSGTCVVNESMLTGESVPLVKSAISSNESDYSEDIYDQYKHKQHTLYGGTKILDIHHTKSDELPRALVINTGFYTEKGKMVESILSPAPVDFKFYGDSLRFILFMGVLGVIGGIIAITVLALQGATAGHIVTRILDLITIVVPPGLPAAITIATLYAQRRLKKANIFCISPPRINISGKIDCMCFDKTGTLTEDGLKLWGVIPLQDYNVEEVNSNTSQENAQFSEVINNCEKLQHHGTVGSECVHAMASCNSLITLNGEVVGDPVDLELFRSVEWVMTESNEGWSNDCSTILCPSVFQEYRDVESLGIIRVHQFSSLLQRMSVVVKRKSNQKKVVYVKGAPETITSLCIKSTVPHNFEEKLQSFTKQGYRVLALASKNLNDENVNTEELTRNSVESDLNFLALVILANPLKPKTTETITSLRLANIRTVMSTGDNLETAVFIARKCDMISMYDKVVTVEATPLEHSDGIKLTWKLDGSDLIDTKTSLTQPNKDIYLSIENGPASKYHLALTGSTFTLLRDHSPTLFNRVLASGTVFARMKPDHKKVLVEGLQKLRHTVGMCGDGANDCGALKSAHAGVALVDTESSIFAHFTSIEKNISCCYKLIREGRAALVTSFGMIKYLCLYSFVQYLTLIVLYTINSYMSDGQFLFADIGVTGVVVVFFAIGGASKFLAGKPPHKSLVSPIMIVCLSLQILLLILFQAVAFVTLKSQNWHTPLVTNMTHPKENIQCEENTVMFYTACFQYLTLAFIFYKGRPHRKPIYKNIIYFVLLILLSCWAVVMMFAAVPPIDSWFSLTPLNQQIGFKFILIACYVIYIICAIFIEHFLLESDWFKRKLDSIFKKCPTIRRNAVSNDNESHDDVTLSFASLRREMTLDTNWPPINSTTVVKT